MDNKGFLEESRTHCIWRNVSVQKQKPRANISRCMHACMSRVVPSECLLCCTGDAQIIGKQRICDVHVGYLFRWWSDLILLCHLCLRVDMILLATTRQSCMCFGSWPGLMISPMHASLGSSSSLSFSYHGCIRWLREWSKYTENNVSLDVGGTGIDGKRSNFQIFFSFVPFQDLV